MENFSDYIVIKAKLLTIFLIMFMGCMVIGGFFIYLNYVHYTQLIGLVILSTLIGCIPISLIGMGRLAAKFFDKANELEVFIRDGGDKDKALEMLYALKEESFHRETNNRLREIAKMVEIKYDIIILKG